MSVVPDRVAKFVRSHDLSGPGVVAVSGGPDSVALLRALLAAEAGPLTVAHLNHKLRGDESDADARFVNDLATGLEVACVTGTADVAAAGGNVESAARQVRYDWLDGVAQQVGATWIATGHTADDQAETVLHRMIRGSGLQGLRGIAVERVSGDGSRRIVRPLMAVTRAAIDAYLGACNQSYRTDSSNADTTLTRNRIRHELLPLLKEFNPQVVPALVKLADQATLAFARLDAVAEELRAKAEKPRAGDVLVFDAATLETAGPAATADLLRLVWQREDWPADGMTNAHWKRLSALQPGDYPGGVHLDRAGAVVRVGPRL